MRMSIGIDEGPNIDKPMMSTSKSVALKIKYISTRIKQLIYEVKDVFIEEEDS